MSTMAGRFCTTATVPQPSRTGAERKGEGETSLIKLMEGSGLLSDPAAPSRSAGTDLRAR